MNSPKRTRTFTEEEFCGYTIHMAYAACWKFLKTLEEPGAMPEEVRLYAREMVKGMALIAFKKYPHPTQSPQLVECWKDMGLVR